MEMSQVVFSDDDDISKHEADLEQIHKSITLRETYSRLPFDFDGRENHFNCSHFDKDPVYRSILEERKNRLIDVFISPLVPPSKSDDVYEFSCEQDCCSNKTIAPYNSTMLPASSVSQENAPSSSYTPRINRYKKLRLRRLHDAFCTKCASASDGDEEFVPPLRDFDTLPEEEEFPRMKLRKRKELWSPDDDLSLADVQLQIVIAESAAEVSKSVTENRTYINEEDNFAFLSSSQQLSPKSERRRGISSTSVEMLHTSSSYLSVLNILSKTYGKCWRRASTEHMAV